MNTYLNLLKKWQRAINLVAPSTLESADQRHFEDSKQLLRYIPETAKTLIDLGSGAGFPGMVLAMARPDLVVTLVDADARKCQFLEAVARETGAVVTILRARIEDIPPTPYDIVTARALMRLPELLDHAARFTSETTKLLFLKGKSADAEIADAQKVWNFSLEIFPSLTDPSGRVLKLSGLKRILSHE